jgi:CheY-like chemotaxis protein
MWWIAEDETDIRNLIATMCMLWGHPTMTFESGQKVWDWLDTFETATAPQVPELVLMDIRMPGKKGNEVAQRMRTIPALARTPILLMTAFSLTESERRAMMTDDGVDHILSKPLPDFEQLRQTLHHYASKGHTS